MPSHVNPGCSRRAAIASGLFSLTLPAVPAEIYAADSPSPLPFKEPFWIPNPSDLRVIPECRGERLTQQPAGAATCKVLIDAEGVVALNSVNYFLAYGTTPPLRLEPDGRRTMAPVEPGKKSSLRMQASASIVRVDVDGRSVDVVVTNGHVLAPAKPEVRAAEFLDPLMDISVVDRRMVIRNARDASGLPIARLAQGITDENITTRVVSFCSKGGGHFRFTGKPYRLNVAIPNHTSPERRYAVFALRVPEQMGDIREQLRGLSGSPVCLEGTREIVGTFTKCYPPHDQPLLNPQDGTKSPIFVVFSGPDRLQAQVMACAKQAAKGKL